MGLWKIINEPKGVILNCTKRDNLFKLFPFNVTRNNINTKQNKAINSVVEGESRSDFTVPY